MKHIAIVQGHPDPSSQRFCRALSDAYARGAMDAGHAVEIIDIADMRFPWLRGKADFEQGGIPVEIEKAQDVIGAADHILIVFPLWLGDMPALLKAFFEQTLRPGFAFSGEMDKGAFQKNLRGKSARVVVTMGMPALVYRWYFGAHGVKNLRRNILQFCGISPVRETLIGLIENKDSKPRAKWLAKAEALGREGV